MLHELKINGLASSPNSLAWSDVGDLCVSTGTKVHLYIPSRKSTSQKSFDPALQPWSVSTIEVNAFTNTEWPIFQQQPFADFSIGEEESEGHVVSCSWSASGLAKHDRCLLGILTANGLFSLWDANGDPSFSTSWQRGLVINNNLRSFFSSQGGVPIIRSPRRVRIRAASWAKELLLTQAGNTESKAHILGVLNDDGEIIVLNVEYSETEHYKVRVIHVLETGRELQSLPDGMLDELQWSDWRRDAGLYSATLTCSTEGYTWEISACVRSSDSLDLNLSCNISQKYLRQIPDWNIPSSQLTMLADKYLNHRQEILRKAWESEMGEGSPCFVRYSGQAAYQGYQALHVSFHPRNSLEYHISTQETSFVIFSHSQLKHSLAGADELKFDWELITDVSNDSALPWTFILQEAPSMHLDHAPDDNSYYHCLRILRLYLVAAFYNGWELDRASQLSEKLVQNQKHMNEEILQTIEEDREEYSSHEALQRIEKTINVFLDSNVGLECCSICNEHLLWHGETSAKCQKGHQFDRCSLTLLAIQEPGISKFCISCNREYLDEKKQFFQDEKQKESSFGDFLLELFKKFPRCIHCGASVQSFT